MAKQINAVLLRGDLLSFMETQGLSALGYSEQVDLTDNVPGAFVARTASELVTSSDEYFAIFGLIVGSYLNVVVHRVPRGLSTVTPRSRSAVTSTADSRKPVIS